VPRLRSERWIPRPSRSCPRSRTQPTGDQAVGVSIVKRALEEPIRIAGLTITTECVIADKPEDDKKMGGFADCAAARGADEPVLVS
jgi:chaperonin GroEL (HSP60 family)